MQFSRFKKIYLIGLNFIILLILSAVLLSVPILLWLGLFMMALESNKTGSLPDLFITVEYILLIIFLPLCLALYFPIIKILSKRFKALRKIKEFVLPSKPDAKDRLITISITSILVIVALVFGMKAFLYLSCASILVAALRITLIISFLKKALIHRHQDNRFVEERLNLIKNWMGFIVVLLLAILVVILKVLMQKI